MDESLSILIQVLQAGAVLTLGIGLIVMAVIVRRLVISVIKVEKALEEIARESRPVFDRARAVGENLNFLVMSVRKEVERAGDTIARANDRLGDAIEGAEERVRELGAVIDIAKEEVEDTLLTASSALRGLRTGAKVLTSRRRRGDDGDASEDEDDE